jgi:hypothetical protein
MKKFFPFVFIIFVACSSKDKKTADPGAKNNGNGSITERLDSFLKATRSLDYEKILDYTYPKLFQMASREKMLDAMKESFASGSVRITFDSLRVDSLFPQFHLGNGDYVKIRYSMRMNFQKVADSNLTDDEQRQEMKSILDNLSTRYGKANVWVDGDNNIIHAHMNNHMVAVKDELSKDWTFVNLEETDTDREKIFPKDVLDKLSTYKD